MPSKHIFTCASGGYIASGTMGPDHLPKIHLPKGSQLTKNEGAGEVQTPVFYGGDTPLSHGDPIIMRHSKAGELAEHFHQIHLIKDGKVIDTYKTYRGFPMLSINNKQWTNWSGSFLNKPEDILYPHNENDIEKIIKRCNQNGKKIRVIGAGHSFTSLAVT